MPLILKNTITETFLERIRLTPDVIGYQVRDKGKKGKWRPVSFGEFYAECELVACGLLALGIRPGEHVAILSRSRLEWALADMAIIGIRAVTVPIYPSLPASEVTQLLEHCEARILFIEDPNLLAAVLKNAGRFPNLLSVVAMGEAASATGPRVLTFDDLKNRGREKKRQAGEVFRDLLLQCKSDDVFTIAYTSGTSGEAKGTMLTHANLMSAIEDGLAVVGKFARPEREVLLTFLPFSHIMGRGESLATFTYGWCQSYVLALEDIPGALLEVRPTLMFAVPRILEKTYSRIGQILAARPFVRRIFNLALAKGRIVYEKRWNKLEPSLLDRLLHELARVTVFRLVTGNFGGRLRYMACGGAPLSAEVAEFFQIMGIQICEGYGLTETCAPLSLNTPEQFRYGSVGKPLPEVELRFEEDGEILVRSKKVFRGYYKMPEQTKAVLRDGWFRTGDLGRLDAAGFLHIIGRKKDLLITSGGKNVAPQKIENLAAQSPLFGHVVVLGDRRPFLVALVTLNETLVKEFAAANSLHYEDYPRLLAGADIRRLVQSEIDKVNSQLASFETIKKFSILPAEFSIQSGHLTPTLKVKRQIVGRDYAQLVDRLYQADSLS